MGGTGDNSAMRVTEIGTAASQPQDARAWEEQAMAEEGMNRATKA